MKLLKIRLRNFRQFKGEQAFRLNTPADKPVTVIFGANGSGKTTLLNSFTWALYGELSEDVEHQERIINDTVWATARAGDRVSSEVEVTFEHEKKTYTARRHVESRKESDSQPAHAPRLHVVVTTPDGASTQVEAGQSVIDTILPRPLSRFFFFNGERIEKLVRKGSYAEVRKDIKILLGLQQVERALDHLPKVGTRLGSEVRKHGGDQAARIQEDIDQCRANQEASQQKIAVLESEVEELTKERDLVDDALRDHAAAAPIQRERDRLQAELEDARLAITTASDERMRLVAESGFLAFTGPMAQMTTSLAEALYQRGALPAPLKREFVDNLIDDGECICGTPLTPGSAAWQSVKGWRERAGLVEVEAAWQRLGGQVDQMASARGTLRELVENATNRLNAGQQRVERLEDQLSERNAELDRMGKQQTDVALLDGKRRDLDKRIAQAGLRLLNEKQEVEANRGRLVSLERQLAAAEVKDEIAVKARKRLQAVGAVQRALEEILAIREDDMRHRLDRQIKEIFGTITLKPYTPELFGDFELGLFQEINGEKLAVPKSTGENQILSLSFVAAVSKLARDIRSERLAEGELAADWGEYPIVMDAAFGSLDRSYQREVAGALARLAPQLIVLVSMGQGMGEVYTQLEPFVSNVGVVVAHSTSRQHPSETIILNGVEHPYTATGSEADWSELIEVSA